MSNVNLLDMIYPVGTIIQTFNSSNPAVIFGGSWTQLTVSNVGKFFLAGVGTGTDENGNSYTLSQRWGITASGDTFIPEMLPEHTHTATANNVSHTYSHTSHGHTTYGRNKIKAGSTYGGNGSGNTIASSSNGAHSHTFTNHTHTSTETTYNASNTPYIFPPSVNCNFWKRTR